MKKIVSIALVIFLSAAAFSQHDMKNMPGMDTAKPEKKQPVIYTCVMHPEIQSPRPGNCPKCGMKLVRKQAKTGNPPIAMPTKPEDVKKADTSIENKNVITAPVPKAGHKPEAPGPEQKPKAVRYDLYVNDTTVNYSG